MDAVEAFRDAYASRLMTPEDQDVDAFTGLPTGEISNTSPWIEHTGLWRYPSGKGPDDDLKQPFTPESYYDEEEDSDDDGVLTEEEVDNLIDELLYELRSEDEDGTFNEDDE